MGLLEEARETAKVGDLANAEIKYKQVLEVESGRNEQLIHEKELALIELGTLYRDKGKLSDLADLIKLSREIMTGYAKSKTSKMIRALLDILGSVPNIIDIQIEVTQDSIDWAIKNKRNFLRQNLQTRLIGLYLDKHSFQDALALIAKLLVELKKLDDKMVLVEVQLLESRVYHALRNIPKARASLTSARTSANSIYCPPIMQAQLDMLSGILHAEDKDYKTAFSYFLEAFESFNTLNDPRAVPTLKYMLLSKIMLNLNDDITVILRGKTVQKYSGKAVDAMKAVAKSHADRSLQEFEASLEAYKDELSSDPIIRSHFSALYDTLLEQNISKVIEPYSHVEISHIAKLVGLDTKQIEGKLSQMILDKVFNGVLDQGNGWLIVYSAPRQDITYDAAVETIKHMSTVVDLLYEKASTLN